MSSPDKQHNTKNENQEFGGFMGLKIPQNLFIPDKLHPFPSRSSQLLNVLSMVIVAGLVVWLYSSSLNFAFFNDDPTGHFAWMQGRSFLDFFISSAAYGYYRPIVFVILKSLVALVGYHAAVFHALLLILHAANVAMVWLLAQRLANKRAYAWAVALIFATMPFSYEAVAYVASLTHPLLLFWLLLTLLLYQNGRHTSRLRWYVGAYLTLILGLLSHENGLFIPLALVGVDWLGDLPKNWRDSWQRPFLPYFIAPILFLLLWFTVPKTSEQTIPTLSTIYYNLIPFLQTLAYPLLPLFSLDAADVGALWLLSSLVLAGTFAAAWWAHARALWLFGLAWFGLSTLPAILFLSGDYLYGSPRLHYLPAVGVSILWGIPVLALASTARKKSWQYGLAGLGMTIYVLLIALTPLSFLRCELDFYAQASRIVWQMRDQAQAADADQNLLFVNVPFFFSSYPDKSGGCENSYPWTPVGAVVVPPYAAVHDFVRFNGGPDRPAKAVTVPTYNPGWNTVGSEMSLAEIRERIGDTAVYVYDLTADSFFDLSAAWQPDVGVVTQPLAVFGDVVTLVETAVVYPDPHSAYNQSESQIEVTLSWQTANLIDLPLNVFVHLYDPNGVLIAQHDGPPAQNFIPWSSLQTTDVVADKHLIVFPADMATGEYWLAVGLYDRENGERLTAVADGKTQPDNIFVIRTYNSP